MKTKTSKTTSEVHNREFAHKAKAKDPWGNDCDRSHGYPVRELYRDRDAAEAAVKIAQKKWLEEQLAEVNKEART